MALRDGVERLVDLCEREGVVFEDGERILAALHASDQETARAEMEKHVVGTVEVIRAEP